MTWQPHSKFSYLLETSPQSSLESLKPNEQCFIRKTHKCGKIYNASKSCFIACPTDDELEPILELISEKLTKVGIEPIIAVKERAYGQDIFCTKICGKIIESRFCIVILDDSINSSGVNIPNPNVYYEYGLMTSLKKHIIPLQKDGLDLAFNIQSYDTVKYSPKNIATELDRAIKDAIKITDSQAKQEKKSVLSEKSIMRKFEKAGLQIRDSSWFLSDVVEDTYFIGFGQYEKSFYVYAGKVDKESEILNYLEDLDVVLFRTEKKAKELEQKLIDSNEQLLRLNEQNQDNEGVSRAQLRTHYFDREINSIESNIKDLESKKQLMSTIHVAFIFSDDINIEQFKEKVIPIINQYERYHASFSAGNSIDIGDIKVNIESAT